jgi:hypothetical protein
MKMLTETKKYKLTKANVTKYLKGEFVVAEWINDNTIKVLNSVGKTGGVLPKIYINDETFSPKYIMGFADNGAEYFTVKIRPTAKYLDYLYRVYKEWRATSQDMLDSGIPGSVDCGLSSVRADFSSYAELEDEITFDEMFEMEKRFEKPVEHVHA